MDICVLIMAYEFKVRKSTNSKIGEYNFEKLAFGQVFTDHMLTCDFKDNEWQTPEIVPFEDISIHPATSALHYGQTIFEGMKAYNTIQGKTVLFRPLSNFERFNKSTVRMCMPNIPEEIFIDGLKELIKVDNQWVPKIELEGSSLYIRPFMFAADGAVGVRPSDTYKFMIIMSPVNAYYPEPIKVLFETHFTRAASGGTGEAKNGGNYGAAMYPTKLAQEKGYKQVIWTDGKEHNFIEESGTMNVFFVINDTVLTPNLAGSILHGVTRDSTIQLFKEKGYKIEERPISVHEIVEAASSGSLKEAFGTGTAATIAHISHIGWEGKDFELPPIKERIFSNYMASTLDGIKTQRLPDNHNWLVDIQS